MYKSHDKLDEVAEYAAMILYKKLCSDLTSMKIRKIQCRQPSRNKYIWW